MELRRIKLLIVEPVSDLGGVSQYVILTARHLPEKAYEVHFAASGDGPLFELLLRGGVTAHRFGIDYTFFSIGRALFALRKLLQAERFDVIHAHTAKAGLLCCLANWRLSGRIVYTGHGFRFSQKRRIVDRWLFFILERFICMRSDCVTLESESEYVLGLTEGLIQAGKSRIVSMSVGLENFSKVTPECSLMEKKKWQIPMNAFVVGMIGRIASQKDPLTFVRTAAALITEIPHIHFIWIGDGPLRESFTTFAAEYGISARLIITGQQESELIPRLLSMLDVVLFTSKFEGLPTALLEAMAARRFVVAADVGSIHDIIIDGTTGWLYRSGAFDEAASAIRRIHQDPKRFEIVRTNAFELVRSKFSPEEKMAGEFADVYNWVLR